MPELEDSPLYLKTLADTFTIKEWAQSGTPIAADVLRGKNFLRAVIELEDVDAAEILLDRARKDADFDKKLIENFEV
ncbi:MAG: hypothetical protein ABIR37_00195 [Candidatus Saccharimonadales bacterium]